MTAYLSGEKSFQAIVEITYIFDQKISLGLLKRCFELIFYSQDFSKYESSAIYLRILIQISGILPIIENLSLESA